MSLEFSRRSFLKYSAVAAVAVAGAGLFTGCDTDSDPNNYYLKEAGDLTVLQVTAAMGTYNSDTKKYEAPDLTGETLTFPMKITNGRTNPIYVNPTNFKVTVSSADGKTTYKYTASNGLTIDGSLTETNLKKDSSVEGNVKVTLDATVEEGGTVTLTYCPDLQYNEYSMNWQLTR